jgi:hypothetical protein
LKGFLKTASASASADQSLFKSPTAISLPGRRQQKGCLLTPTKRARNKTFPVFQLLLRGFDLDCQEVKGFLHQGLRACTCGPYFLVEVVFNEDTNSPTFE